MWHDEIFEFIVGDHSVAISIQESFECLGLSLGQLATMRVHLVLKVNGCEISSAGTVNARKCSLGGEIQLFRHDLPQHFDLLVRSACLIQ